MIIYEQGTRIYETVFRVHGSALYKGLLPALLSSFILLVLNFLSTEPTSNLDHRWFQHPYPIAAMLAAFTFLLSFKTSFSYNRYWEACTAIHQMHSKWIDVGTNLAAWHLQSKRYDDIRPPSFGSHPTLDSVVRKRQRKKLISHEKLREILARKSAKNDEFQDAPAQASDETLRVPFWKRITTNKKNKELLDSSSPQLDEEEVHPSKYSINSARSVRGLADDAFSKYDSAEHPARPIKSVNPMAHHTPTRLGKMSKGMGMGMRMSQIISVAYLDGGMEAKSPSLFLQEASHLLSLMSAVAFASLRNDVQKAPSPLAEYKVGSPWPPVDPDQVKKGQDDFYAMSKFRKLANFLLGFTRSPAQRTLYNACRPFEVLGGVSDAEIDLLQRARGPFAKTALCSMWLEEFVSREFESGALGKTAGPIVSRIYQFTSDGMLGYNQARKVACIPFPFPHTQLTTFFVVVVILFSPILMLTFVTDVAVAAVLNILTVGVFVGLWQVSNELEDPFRNVPNDLPLNHFQSQFNEGLVVMFAGYHPESWWDIGDAPDRAGIDHTDLDTVAET